MMTCQLGSVVGGMACTGVCVMMTCHLLGSVVGGHGLYRCLCYDYLPPTGQCSGRAWLVQVSVL